MNTVTLMGRIASDLELKRTQNGKVMMSFMLAVSRQKDTTDFIRCTAWGKSAEFISRYFTKGRMIALLGYIRAGTYTDRDGNSKYIMNVVVEKSFFTGEKKSQQNTAYQNKGYVNQYSRNYGNQNRNNGYSGYGNY
ncbi:MAG: single-stranded DNA-binding protein [Ruminococcus sp.]